jgi:hypothetical protein
MDSDSSSRWFSFLNSLLLAGVFLAVILAVALVWSLAKQQAANQTWGPRAIFALGATWTTLFAGGMLYAVRGFGGAGFESSIYILVFAIALESTLLGILAFHSYMRILAVIPALAGIYATFPWLIAQVSR